MCKDLRRTKIVWGVNFVRISASTVFSKGSLKDSLGVFCQESFGFQNAIALALFLPRPFVAKNPFGKLP